MVALGVNFAEHPNWFFVCRQVDSGGLPEVVPNVAQLTGSSV
jgi:hypothetical protein